MRIVALIPARNEAGTVGAVVRETLRHVDAVVVADDASDDGTAHAAVTAGAEVRENERPLGYVRSLRRHLRTLDGDIVVTLDADGEHDPADILKVIQPIIDCRADLVFGAVVPAVRTSEAVLDRVASVRTHIRGTGAGLRAMRLAVARSVPIRGTCGTGVFALDAKAKGFRLATVPITLVPVAKPRGIAWHHGRQFLWVVRALLGD